ncbi:MAG: potassium channel family protein [Clostridium perfringens]|nr:potassium channel family protein [Clostridium perfringens]
MRVYKRFICKFIIFYILVVIFFAFLYTYFSNDFYYSLSSKEILFDKEHFYVEKYLENTLKNNFKNYYNSNYLVLFNGRGNKDFIFNIDDLKVVETRIENGSLESDISIILKNNRDDLEYKATITLKILDGLIIEYENNIYKECEINIKNNSKALNGVELSKIFRVKYLDGFLGTGIILDTDLNERIKEYIRNNDGNPSLNKKSFFYYLKYNFPRMLYLSMVTITTLGFGDIVPLTTTTRMLIGIESTIGVIILGWFVNKSIKDK